MKDKIEETITFHFEEREYYGADWAEYAADAIIKALPDYEAQQARITELEAALIRLRSVVWPAPSEDSERYREEYEACEVADAALKGEET
tara:strand:+ start:82 stop:351 length:270 start_codon:yes stop_codon:yes gene_type:complete